MQIDTACCSHDSTYYSVHQQQLRSAYIIIVIKKIYKIIRRPLQRLSGAVEYNVDRLHKKTTV